MEENTNELEFLNEGIDIAGNTSEELANTDCGNFLVYIKS